MHSNKSLRDRAAEVLKAWGDWRARRVKIECALEASAFVTMLLAWGVGYAVLCPVEPARHRAAQVQR